MQVLHMLAAIVTRRASWSCAASRQTQIVHGTGEERPKPLSGRRSRMAARWRQVRRMPSELRRPVGAWQLVLTAQGRLLRIQTGSRSAIPSAWRSPITARMEGNTTSSPGRR